LKKPKQNASPKKTKALNRDNTLKSRPTQVGRVFYAKMEFCLLS
jgi:hypothetical protein